MDASLFEGSLVTSSRVLYTPSPFARSNLIHLQETGSLTARQPHTSARENLVSYLFFLVRSGAGQLEYGGQTYPLKAGDCVFLDCHRPYSHSTSLDLWQLDWVHFFGPNMPAIYEKYVERGGLPCFCPADPAPYLQLLHELAGLAGSDEYVRDMLICEKLLGLLTLLMRESWHPESGSRTASKKQNLQRVKDYLDLHFAERITLDELSEQFYINKFYLTRIFKEQFGVSINTYLLQMRVTHAKQLLRFSDKALESIGVECGLGDPHYFSRIFRRVEGVTPSAYRKMW